MSSLLLPATHPSLPRSRITQPIRGIKRFSIHCSQNKQVPLSDDGYLTGKGIIDYHDAVSESLRFDQGPPRWFCPVDCGPPAKGSPLMLYLPGIDGIGMGLFMHHKALGRIFEVRCMHVPFSDRTPFEGLLMFVEDVVRREHSACDNKPIYMLGHSFGGCLALSIAARNPNIDLMVILTNPATCFGESKVQTLLPVLSSLGQLNVAIPLFLILCIDNQVQRGLESINNLNPLHALDELSRDLISLVKILSCLLGKISNESISWKLKLLKLAAMHANSRLHAVKAEVLVFASCLDSLLPGGVEGEKLAKLLPKCKVCYFENYGHHIIMENGFHLCSIIKSSGFYRRGRQHDCIKDFVTPTITEQQEAEKTLKLLHLASSPVIFSTMDDGRIVRGLSGLPSDGPVLLVGNHMLLGLDVLLLMAEFLREKRTILRGMGHPYLFEDRRECSFAGHHFYDFVRLSGAAPVSGRNLYRLLSEKSFVLLYPGGVREALHVKGEEYKLFWPDQPEFVRMAARFGAKIVPFGSVGEDDLGELVLDHNDLMSIPFIKNEIIGANHDAKPRNNDRFGVEDQNLLLPLILPKVPGRYYYLFGKPIGMDGNDVVLKDREAAIVMYLRVKSEVESIVSYLLKKREEDAFRCIFHRSLFKAIWGPHVQIPSFEP